MPHLLFRAQLIFAHQTQLHVFFSSCAIELLQPMLFLLDGRLVALPFLS